MKRAKKINEKIEVRFDGVDFRPSLDLVKSIKGRIPDIKNKRWFIPHTQENIDILKHNNFTVDSSLIGKNSETVKKTIKDKSYKKIKLPSITSVLKWFQKEGTQFIIHNNGGLLSFDCGLGKTLTSIMTMETKKTFPLLIVSPASIKYGFKKEYLKWFPDTKKKIKILHGYDSIKNYDGIYDIVIVNYELFVPFIKQVDTGKRTVYRATEELKDFILNNFEGIIMDECQYIKGEKSKRYHALKYICKHIDFKIALSATPIFKKPKEFFNILNILRPDIFSNRWKFQNRYCDPQIKRFGKKTFRTFDGLSNGEELNNILTDKIMIRFMKDDKGVLDDFPKKNFIPVYLELSDYQKYKDTLKQLEDDIKEGKKIGLQKINILKQLVYELKKESCFNYIDDLLTKEDKIVLFCQHTKVIDDFKEKYKRKIVTINGSTSAKKREEYKERFRTSKQCKIMIGNSEAMGVGIDGLQDVCHTGGFVEFPWNSATVDQNSDRIYRMGQTHLTNVYCFVGANTIDEDIIQLIDESRKVFNRVMEGKEVEEFDLIGKLLQKLKNK